MPSRRWYYDHKTGWYYGGDPVEWTQTPSIPSAAMFGVAPHEGGSAPAAAAAAGGKAAAAAGSKAGSSSSQPAATAAGAAGAKVVKKVVQLPSHPQAGVGGHQMPVSGRIGGAKGVGSSDPQPDTQKVGNDGAAGFACVDCR